MSTTSQLPQQGRFRLTLTMTSADQQAHAPLLSESRDEGEHNEYEEDVLNERVEEEILHTEYDRPSPARAYFIRALALLCACSLSIGSH